jgi:hypothetical protein
MRSSDDSSTALPPPPIYNNNAVFDPAGLETAAQFAVKFSQNRNGKLEATRMKENEKHQQAKMQEDMAVARTETQNALKKLRRAEKDVKKELSRLRQQASTQPIRKITSLNMFSDTLLLFLLP